MRKITTVGLLLAVALALALALATSIARAQASGYSLNWWTVDGGGAAAIENNASDTKPISFDSPKVGPTPRKTSWRNRNTG